MGNSGKSQPPSPELGRRYSRPLLADVHRREAFFGKSPLSDRCGIARAIATDPDTASPKGATMEEYAIYLYSTSGGTKSVMYRPSWRRGAFRYARR